MSYIIYVVSSISVAQYFVLTIWHKEFRCSYRMGRDT